MVCVRCQRELPEGSLFCNFCGKRQPAAPPPQRRKRRRAKGTGTVYKLPGRRAKPWAAVAADGTLIGTFADAGEAVTTLDAVNAKKVSASRLAYTFTDVYERWSALHFPEIGSSGVSSYRNAYRKSEPLYHRKMADLKTEDYQAIIETMKAKGASRSLCEKQRQLFSQLCQYAIQQDIIHTNYATGLHLPAANAPKTRIFSAAEIDAIRSMVPDKRLGETAKIALVLIYTGMRLNELLLARAENVHLPEHYLIAGEKTDAGRDRTIPIHESVESYIAAWLVGRSAGYLIQSAGGVPRDHNNVRKSFQSLMKRLGITGVSPHTCRHTAATRMLAAGLPVEVVQQILGHADATTTLNIYTHPDVATLVAGVRKMD